MASGTGTVTIDAGEWVYPDSNNVEHTVTTSETFDIAVTDTSSTVVKWLPADNQSVTTTDGYTIEFESNPDHGYLILADTDNTVATSRFIGDWVIKDPVTGLRERWICRTATIDDVDDPSTITATFEAQEPTREFTWTAVDISYA